MAKKSKAIHTSGKRKSAVARATITPGKGLIRINNRAIATWGTALLRMRVKEPLLLAGKHSSTIDIDVNVNGGGPTGQADAARLAIGRALVEHDKKLKPVLLDYDRQLLVADVRRKEAAKPNRMGSARSKKPKGKR